MIDQTNIIRMYEFEWLCSVLGLDCYNFLCVLGFDGCCAELVFFLIPINRRSYGG